MLLLRVAAITVRDSVVQRGTHPSSFEAQQCQRGGQWAADESAKQHTPSSLRVLRFRCERLVN